jgi:hypothetical protein
MDYTPDGPVGCVFFVLLILSDSGAAEEVANLASSGPEIKRPTLSPHL